MRDLTDSTINNWYIRDRAGKDDHGNATWNCKCLICGKWYIKPAYVITSGHSKSCGCTKGSKDLTGKIIKGRKAIKFYNGKWECECIECGKRSFIQTTYFTRGDFGECSCKREKKENLKGKVFGSLRVEDYNLLTHKWKCKCLLCNNYSEVRAVNLKNGSTTSCGCKKSNIAGYKDLEINNIKIIEHIKNTRYWRYTCEKCGYIGVTRDYKIKDGICSCDVCGSHKIRSRYEYELEKIFGTAVKNSKTIIKGHEIDLYYPQERVGIEFNGNYWHCDKFRNKEYHQRKSIACISNGIRLINIYEYEWLNPIKRKILTDIVNRALNKSEVNKVYARKTKIKYIETEEIRGFLNENHLQGYTASSVNLGLYNNGKLVEVMTFGKPRFNTECEWELIRLCTKLGYSVVGGSEKLFKAFLREYSPKSIISYCNIGKFDGSVYFKLGFRFKRVTSPNYAWVNLKSGEILTRYQTMKREIIKRFNLSENCMDTEDDIMKFYGFMKIYDSGNAVLRWNREI